MNQRSKNTSHKKWIQIQCNTENFVPIVVPGLSSSSSSSSHPSTSVTPLRHECNHPTSSSSSSTSPTTAVSSDSETRERKDLSGIDSHPVPVSSSHVEEMIERSDPLFPKPSKNPKPNKDETTIERGDPLCSDIPEWLQEFRENLVMTEFLNTETHTPVLLMNYLWSLRLREVRIRVNTVFILISQKDRNCEICQRTKITRAPCSRRIGRVVLRAENFGDLITADHKVLSESCESRNNHRFAIVVQDLAAPWVQSYPCKPKTSQETQRSLQKFLEPDRKPEVIYADNSLEFGKACEDLSWNQCKSTPHRSETNGIAERAGRRVKEGTSAVFLQSGLDEMECFSYLRKRH